MEKQVLQLKYVPFVKVDEERRWVYGRATDETLDVEGEVVDFEATKRAVTDWGKWRNIREMHGANAVGVAEEINLDDVQRSLEIGVKVVDNQAWEKVRAGVYKGFSIGGRRRAATVEKTAGGEVRRITDYLMTEISLVDRPANPNAVFSLVKREDPHPALSLEGRGEDAHFSLSQGGRGEEHQHGLSLGGREETMRKGSYPWSQCMADQTEKYGSEETARKVCGMIRAKYGHGKSVSSGQLAVSSKQGKGLSKQEGGASAGSAGEGEEDIVFDGDLAEILREIELDLGLVKPEGGEMAEGSEQESVSSNQGTGASAGSPSTGSPSTGSPSTGSGGGEKRGLGVEEVKALVVQILRDVGLVREELAASAAVEDLRKVTGGLAKVEEVARVSEDLAKTKEEVGRVMTALEVMHKVTLDLAKGKDVERVSGDLAKMGGDLAKAIGDMTKVAAAVDTLEERLEVVWKMAAGQGPVLREIGFFGPVSLEGQEESVLKGLMDETDNPQLRQLIGARIAELQIRAVHDQYRRR